MKRAILGLSIVVLVISALTACGAPRLLMRSASSREIPPPDEGRARVVLAVPGNFRDVLSVVDEHGQYLGQLGAHTYFTVSVAPGNRRFYALVGSSSYVVGGTVEAGRTYWIVGEDALTRPFRWFSSPPECGADPLGRVTGARAIEPDPQADPGGMLARQLGNVPQRILEADQELQAMPESERAPRTLSAPACDAGGQAPTDQAPADQPATGSETGATDAGTEPAAP